MALLKIKGPTQIEWSHWIESLFVSRYALRKVKIKEMLTLKKFYALTKKGKNFLITSKSVHGIEDPSGAIFVHPDPVLKSLKRTGCSAIKRLQIETH
jgi:hypothetical protein